jgi:hypothetical protein
VVAKIGAELDLHALHEAEQLVPDVARALHAPHLHHHMCSASCHAGV